MDRGSSSWAPVYMYILIRFIYPINVIKVHKQLKNITKLLCLLFHKSVIQNLVADPKRLPLITVDDNVFVIIKSHCFLIYLGFNMVSFRGKKGLGHAHIGFL